MNDQKLDNLLRASNVFAELVDWYYAGWIQPPRAPACNER